MANVSMNVGINEFQDTFIILYNVGFVDHAMRCLFEEGILGECNRVRFNQYYQDENEFQMAWQVSSNNNARMLTTTDVTDGAQRGVATIVPHNMTGTLNARAGNCKNDHIMHCFEIPRQM